MDAASVDECARQCSGTTGCRSAVYSARATVGNCLLSVNPANDNCAAQDDALVDVSTKDYTLQLNCVKCGGGAPSQLLSPSSFFVLQKSLHLQ